jgi:uncharacterized membrane protein YbhN (UPF0104 family)
LFGVPRSGPPEERDYISHFSDPKRAALMTESTFVSIGRAGAAYFGTIALFAYVCFLIASFVPFLRFALGVVFVAFVGLWTLLAVLFEIDLRKARRQYRQREASKSSNQSLQLTADRPDDQPSIHETALTTKMSRFRQR